MRQPFDLLTFPLDGLRLIEASAGTGKTFSLAGLYLRLVVEKRLDVRQILVMTFTRAATQELRERIRSRITTAAVLAADPTRAVADDVEHAIALELIARAEPAEPREQIAHRLRGAAARMDDATVATIHGFAQLAAQENAFDSALPFDRGTQVDDPAVHRDAVTDYWRSQVLGRAAAEARAFLEIWPTPEDLYQDLRAPLERPYLQIRRGAGKDLEPLIGRARTLWASERGQLQTLLEAVVADNRLLKNKPLDAAVAAGGGVAGLMSHLDAGLTGTASGFPILPAWITDLTTDDGVREHIWKSATQTFRPQDLALVHALAALAPAGRIAALEAAFLTARARIAQHKRDARQFSFADMIEQLHAAISHPGRGETLARALARTWPYALVDEFQDTDPLQYDILRAIYCPGNGGTQAGGLTMIGDPKQAIFAFRGGDVFAYLHAAGDADGVYGLGTNFRSSPGVLDGIEALFHGEARHSADGEFLVPGIHFQHVESSRNEGDRLVLRNGKPLPPMTVWALPDDAMTGPAAREMLIEATVSEIVALLGPTGARIRAGDGSESAVRPNDIAALVNTNREAAELQRALARRGIGAVCLHRASVFETEQALDLLYVLRAASSSARPESVRAALATPLFGVRLADLTALTEDEPGWHRQAARFQDAHETWRTRGVLPMLEPILQAAAPRLLALEDGERRMTNYLQLAELLARAETTTFGSTGLLHWLADEIAHPQPDAEVDSQQLKLESDDELVRITTVHRAKGLEYPIVFAPFTPFLGAREQKRPWTFHDKDGHAWLDFGLDAGNQPAANRESRAEALRLLYVALTRAKDAVYLAWGSVNGAQNSALAWLLHPADGLQPGSVDRGKPPPWLTAAGARKRLEDCASRANGRIRVTDLPAALADGFRAPAGHAPEGTARTDLPARRRDWSVLSFSRLVVGGGRTWAADRGAEDEIVGAMPDEQLGTSVTTHGAQSADSVAAAGAAIALQGPAFGNAIHKLLESLPDPQAWPTPADRPSDLHRNAAARHLHNAGLTLGDGAARRALLDDVCRLISRTLHTPLPEIGPLAKVPAHRRLVEMEFYLNLGGERVGRVLELLNAHGYTVTLPPDRAARRLSGLMQGFIDLTVEADGGYWILDYKTNRLGPVRADYQGECLARAVRHGNYDLQYLIYLVALHRHLGRTLADYDPARHLRGAQYLFLRGLDGESADTGVFVDRPPADFIMELDARFAAAPVAA